MVSIETTKVWAADGFSTLVVIGLPPTGPLFPADIHDQTEESSVGEDNDGSQGEGRSFSPVSSRHTHPKATTGISTTTAVFVDAVARAIPAPSNLQALGEQFVTEWLQHRCARDSSVVWMNQRADLNLPYDIECVISSTDPAKEHWRRFVQVRTSWGRGGACEFDNETTPNSSAAASAAAAASYVAEPELTLSISEMRDLVASPESLMIVHLSQLCCTFASASISGSVLGSGSGSRFVSASAAGARPIVTIYTSPVQSSGKQSEPQTLNTAGNVGVVSAPLPAGQGNGNGPEVIVLMAELDRLRAVCRRQSDMIRELLVDAVRQVSGKPHVLLRTVQLDGSSQVLVEPSDSRPDVF